nr:hypothetical protein [Bacteroidota bacterium]
MKEKQIELLQQQIDKLNSKDFDLEAWKNYTIVLLARLFGENNQKIKQIEKLEYEYNSWSLRNTSGFSSYLQTCKKLGKEILEASINEIENFGIPEIIHDQTKRLDIQVLLSALEDELKGSQYKSIMRLLKSGENEEEKKRQLLEQLQDIEAETIKAVLISILMSKDFIANLD